MADEQLEALVYDIEEEEGRQQAYRAIATVALERLNGPPRWDTRPLTRELRRYLGGPPQRSGRGPRGEEEAPPEATLLDADTGAGVAAILD